MLSQNTNTTCNGEQTNLGEFMECLSEEVLDNEFQTDSSVWIIVDSSDPEHHLYFPKNVTTLALFGFMKKDDAAHLVRLLKAKAPDYREMEMGITTDVLSNLRKAAEKNNIPLCVWSPIDSKEFFDRYEDMLGIYYGL